MDPAQLEADIAALTGAIAEEAAGLDGASEGVPSYHGHPAARDAARVASSRPSTEPDSHYENEGSGLGGLARALKGLEVQYPPQFLPHSPQQSARQSPLQQPPVLTQQQVYRHTGQGAQVPVPAPSRGVPKNSDRHKPDHQETQEQPSSPEDR